MALLIRCWENQNVMWDFLASCRQYCQ